MSSVVPKRSTPKEAPVIHFNGPLTVDLDNWAGPVFVPSDGSPLVPKEM